MKRRACFAEPYSKPLIKSSSIALLRVPRSTMALCDAVSIFANIVVHHDGRATQIQPGFVQWRAR